MSCETRESGKARAGAAAGSAAGKAAKTLLCAALAATVAAVPCGAALAAESGATGGGSAAGGSASAVAIAGMTQAELEKLTAELELQIAQAQADKAAAEQELAKSKEKTDPLNKRLAEANEKLEKLKAEYTALETELGQEAASADKLQGQVEQLEKDKAPAPEPKAAQKIAVTGYKVLKAKKLKKRAIAFKAVEAEGALTVKKAAGSGKLSVSSGGTVKVKKGTRKGTYTMRISVKAAATDTAGAASATVPVTVRVK